MGIGSFPKLGAGTQDGPRIISIAPLNLDIVQQHRFQQEQLIHPLHRLNASLPGVPSREELFEPVAVGEKAKERESVVTTLK
jgi:hypothetical protein